METDLRCEVVRLLLQTCARSVRQVVWNKTRINVHAHTDIHHYSSTPFIPADGVSLTISIDICYREELCALCEIQRILCLWRIRRWRMCWSVQRQQAVTLPCIITTAGTVGHPSTLYRSQRRSALSCWSSNDSTILCMVYTHCVPGYKFMLMSLIFMFVLVEILCLICSRIRKQNLTLYLIWTLITSYQQQMLSSLTSACAASSCKSSILMP